METGPVHVGARFLDLRIQGGPAADLAFRGTDLGGIVEVPERELIGPPLSRSSIHPVSLRTGGSGTTRYPPSTERVGVPGTSGVSCSRKSVWPRSHRPGVHLRVISREGITPPCGPELVVGGTLRRDHGPSEYRTRAAARTSGSIRRALTPIRSTPGSMATQCETHPQSRQRWVSRVLSPHT